MPCAKSRGSLLERDSFRNDAIRFRFPTRDRNCAALRVPSDGEREGRTWQWPMRRTSGIHRAHHGMARGACRLPGRIASEAPLLAARRIGAAQDKAFLLRDQICFVLSSGCFGDVGRH